VLNIASWDVMMKGNWTSFL